jgi:hypothetical protein
MGAKNTLPTIPASTRNAIGVVALADRPNASLQYGESGLSAAQLKARFDKFANALADKLGEISSAFQSDDAAKYIRIALDSYGVGDLDDLITAFQDGTFAEEICKSVNPFSTIGEKQTVKVIFAAIANKFTELYAQVGADLKIAIDAFESEKLKPLEAELIALKDVYALWWHYIDQAVSIAKGANKSLSYKDYAEMFLHVPDMTEDARLNIGQNIYIAALNVPDLWVSGWQDGPSYGQTAEEFERRIKENGTAMCGHYVLSVLETQKVDLSNYYTKEEVDQIKQDAVNEAAIYVEEWF